MELLILDTNFVAVDTIDIFESVLWTDRFNSFGDFEIFAPVSDKMLQNLKYDYYLWLEGSNHTMIVEDLVIASDFENGARLIVTGRSLESILDRRIIWKKTVLAGDFELGIKKLLDENIISPTDTARAISNFRFEFSNDPVIEALTIDAQFTGENLYDVIQYMCDIEGIGFKVTLEDTTNDFVFKLYSGVDRTYAQSANPYVIFSPKFENLINSNYVESKKTLKNVTLVAGEEYDTTKDDVEAALIVLQANGNTFVDVGAGIVRKTVVVAAPGEYIDNLGRREMFSDARDITQTIEGVKMTDTVYFKQLTSRGASELTKNSSTQSFEGSVETTHSFIFGEDYFMGDKVQIINEFEFESVVRIVEVVRSHSLEGETILPTFSKVQ